MNSCKEPHCKSLLPAKCFLFKTIFWSMTSRWDCPVVELVIYIVYVITVLPVDVSGSVPLILKDDYTSRDRRSRQWGFEGCDRNILFSYTLSILVWRVRVRVRVHNDVNQMVLWTIGQQQSRSWVRASLVSTQCWRSMHNKHTIIDVHRLPNNQGVP